MNKPFFSVDKNGQLIVDPPVLQTGDIVELTALCLSNSAGSRGLVVGTYDERSAFILFKNGEFDGFSPDEQIMYIQKIGHSEGIENYRFENVMKLQRDFESGLFDTILKTP